MTAYVYNDGGRKAAGYAGNADDCVARAIAIATGKPYTEVYRALAKGMADRTKKGRGSGTRSARNGVFRDVYEPYLLDLGWAWTPTMQIGQGCKVHLTADELPGGSLIVAVSKHLCAVIDGQVQDTSDPSRDGTRCVYGYYQQR